MGNLSRTQVLDLSDNNYSGKIPKRLLTDCPSLTALQHSNNKLEAMYSRKFIITRLQILLSDRIRFTGVLTNEVTHGRMLNMLDISDNMFSGVVPRWISNLTSLNALVMRNNMFEGQFPCGEAQFLFLDISRNSFSGSFPSCLNLQGTEHIHLDSNRFTGLTPQSFHNLSSVLTLDMGNNKLSGRIPELLGLSNNSLSGSVPNCLQNISGPSHLAFIEATTLSSSRHSFFNYGSVLKRDFNIHGEDDIYERQDEVQFITKSRPDTYKGRIFVYMSGLDLSCNNLTGRLPEKKAQFGTFFVNNYEGNPFLYRPQLEMKCTPVKCNPRLTTLSVAAEEDEEKGYDIDLVFFGVSVVSTWVVFLLGLVAFFILILFGIGHG